jgi:hypothetical protein
MRTLLDRDDIKVMTWALFAASVCVTVLALFFDWFLADGVVTFLRSQGSRSAYELGLDLLPWAGLFTVFSCCCAYSSFRVGRRMGHDARPETRQAEHPFAGFRIQHQY